MKRIFIPIAAVALCGAATLRAEEKQPEDSLRVYRMQEIEVTATRATKTTPVAYTDLSREAIERSNFGRDIPSLLQTLPSMIATSEAGTGIGGTALRLRGSDGTRINVTMNGVPMNDGESHSVYWYDTPDLISSVGTIQVQRGAGTSTNGTGAFGGSINMTSSPLSTRFGGNASLSYGSYNTNKQAVGINSGLLGGHWLLNANYTHVGSDGYVDRASTKLHSYRFQAAYYGDKTSVRLLSFGGKARVYLAYSGIDREMLETDRTYNPEGAIKDADGNVIGFYKDHTDNYTQINNQLIVNHRFNDRWNLNLTAHYTRGDGYYEQYKNGAYLPEYGIESIGGVTTSNLVRRKRMSNDFAGFVSSANYTGKRIRLSLGGAWNIYDGVHWGEIIDVAEVPAFGTREYYRNGTTKHDANLFVKANWEVARGLNIYADMQYRHISHRITGVNDNFDETTDALQKLDVNRKYDFFNPKAGIVYRFADHHSLYASFAVAQKEPTRNNFTDIKQGEFPVSEHLQDWELGYSYSGSRFSAGVNLYYMNYKDQLVLTGETSDTGEALMRNIPDSYRRGIELTASAQITRWFTFSAHAAFSQNRIENYVDHIDGISFDRGTTTIAYSPSVIAGTVFDFHFKGFSALLQTSYVSKQYLTNGEWEDLTLDRYCVTNLDLSYTFSMKHMRSIRVGMSVNNLFNTDYCNNGFGGSWMEGDTIDKRRSWAAFFPQAPLNVLANITVHF